MAEIVVVTFFLSLPVGGGTAHWVYATSGMGSGEDLGVDFYENARCVLHIVKITDPLHDPKGLTDGMAKDIRQYQST